MGAQPTQTTISLLWPQDAEHQRKRARTRGAAEWHDSAVTDLGLTDLAHALSLDRRHEEQVRAILLTLCDNPRVIACRQEVLDDLLRNDALAAGLHKLLPSLGQLSFYGNPGRPNEPALQQTIFRLGELELYLDCVQQLRALLLAQGDGLHAEGFIRLRDALTVIEQDASFQALRAELPDMLAKVRNIGSVTIGVNLDSHLMPSEATLLSINTYRFKGAGLQLINRLLGKSSDANGDANAGAQAQQGLARLHRIALPEGMPHTRANLMLVPLFKDLSEILEATARPIADALMRYARLSGQFLIALESEVAFYLGAINLIRRMQSAGLPMCRPEIAPREDRMCVARDLYNINLALRLLGHNPNTDLSTAIVTNNVSFDDPSAPLRAGSSSASGDAALRSGRGAGRIFILTGPNQGGKTTFIQAIGVIHVMAQAGLMVPCHEARLSPVDAIFTHFATEERPSLESGRLGEEAQRLHSIFEHATRHSLVLLNESLSSTSPSESLYLSQDVVRGLRLLGARAIFATHLHDLAKACAHINADTQGDSTVASLVSQTLVGEGEGEDEAGRRTYKIVPAPPQGTSFARDIARKYGISFEQIEEVVKRKT